METLKWYEEMGVDEAIADEPINRLAIVNEPNSRKVEQPKQDIKFVSPAHAVMDTRQQADSCNTRGELEQVVRAFKGLSITKTATNTVFSDGNPESSVMMIGEAPGAEEDAQGVPFCGASGKMLDQMFSYIGLERSKNFYITNTIFWRPPGNRKPTPEELAICLPFVERHIYLIKPKLIILVGGTAVTSVLGNTQGITRLRGQFFEYSNQYLDSSIKTTAVFHPSYLLRSPGQKQLAWRDILMIREHMQ